MKKQVFYVLLMFIFGINYGQITKVAPVNNTGVSEQGDYYSNQNALFRTEINHTSKSMSLWALPSDGSTSGNTRIPGNSFKFQRTEYLITAAEIAASGFPNGNTIDGIGFLIATAGATTQTGTLKIWLKNTTDVTYTLGSTWTTSGFIEVNNNTSWTVPITAGAYTIPFIGGSSFTYSGGGVYVAWEFSNTGTAGTTALIANCNLSLTGGLYGQRSATALPTTLAASNWRPATMFINNSMNDIADITNIYCMERVPTPFGIPAPINVRVANVSSSAAAFDLTITVKDATNTIVRYTSTQTVSSLAANSASIYTFSGWAPTITEDVNITATTSAITGDTWTANNTRTKVASVNNNLYSYNYSMIGAGSFGFTYSATYTGGLFVSKFTMNGTGAVPGANLFIANNAASTGNTIYAVVLNSAGTVVAQSANYVIQATDLNTNKNFIFPSPPVFTNETFYVALAQTPGTAQYYPMGTFNETPGRTATFYTTTSLTGGALTQVPTTNNLKLGIEAQVVAFSGPNNPTSVLATPVSTSEIDLSYLPNTNVNNVLLAWSTTNTFGIPVNGTTYLAGDPIVGGGTVLQYNNLTSFAHTGLSANTTFYYKVWSYDGSTYSGGIGVNAKTHCTSTVLPFTENFDTYTVPALGCGTILDANADNIKWVTSSSNAFSGTKKLSIGYSAIGVTMNDWYFTQGLDLVSGLTYDVKFYYRAVTATFPERLEVKWGTAPSVAGMTSSAIFSSVDFVNTTYALGSGTFSPSSSGTFYLGWHCYSQPDEDGIYLDSITVTELAACPMPTGLTVNNITNSQATLGWTNTGLSTTWDLQWGAAGFVLGSGTIITGVNSNPYTLTGLSPSTPYSYYVRANCVGNNSTWNGPYNFTTICASAATPFTENFENSTFPTACWSNTTVSGSYLWTRSTAASGNGEGAASAIANFYDQLTGIYELKSIPFDISTLTAPTLKFNYAYATYATEVDSMIIYYSTNLGITWSSLLVMPGGVSGILNTGGVSTSAFVPTASQWSFQSLPLPSGCNMLKFKAISAYGNNLYLDNIQVYSPLAHNVAAISIDLNQVVPLGSPLPKATVSNTGLNVETFDVTLTIGTYTSTKTVTSLAPNSSIQISFDAWNNAIGDYSASLEAMLASDMDLSNNSVSKSVKVMNLNKTVYGYQNSTISGPVKFNLNDPLNLTLIANQTSLPAINGGTWANGTWYGTATNTVAPYNLVSIDTITGARTIVGDMGIAMNGLSYNTANSTLYGVSYNSTTTQSSLYTINMTNGSITLIGSTSPNTLLINLAINNSGECYTVDITSDQLGLVNLTTGAFTPIGPIGFNAGYAQDMEFDRETGDLYMAAYGSTGELKWVDKTTGNTLLINKFQNGYEITGFAIPYRKTLSMKAYLEGIYNSNGIMNQAQNDAGSQWGNNIADKLTVELHSSVIPYNTLASFTNIDLHTDGSISVNVPSNMSDSYYIVLKHRNSITTWSNFPLSFGGTAISFDFTTAASQAYGNNQILLAPGIFGIYTGDVNQDGLVDGSDMSDTETDNNNFVTGYVVTDVNGDGLIDGSDMSIVETANNNFVSSIIP